MDDQNTDNKDLTSAPSSNQLSLLSAIPRDAIFAVFEHVNLVDYDSLWMTNAHHRQLVAAYLRRSGCKLRENNNHYHYHHHRSHILSTLRRVTASVDVLQLPFVTLSSEIVFHIQRIVSCSRNSLTVIELSEMELLRVYPFLMGCSRLRVCRGLTITQDRKVPKQFKSFLQSSNAIRSMTLSFDHNDCDAKAIVELVVTSLACLESLDLTLSSNQLAAAWSHLTKLSSALTSLKLHLTDGDSTGEHSCRRIGLDLQAFSVLKSLTFNDASDGEIAIFPHVVWTLPPMVTHYANNICTTVFDAKQIQSWFGNVYNDVPFFFGITVPNMTELCLHWSGDADQPLIDEASLVNFYAPLLTKFTVVPDAPPNLLPMTLHMPALRFLDLKLCVVLSIEDVLYILRSTPLVECVNVSAWEKLPLCSAFLAPQPSPLQLLAPSASSSSSSSSSSLPASLSRVREDEKKEAKHHILVNVPYLRRMQLAAVHADSLVDALLSISSPRLFELRIECITEPADGGAILRHYSWLTPFHGMIDDSCFFCQGFAADGNTPDCRHHVNLFLSKKDHVDAWSQANHVAQFEKCLCAQKQ